MKKLTEEHGSYVAQLMGAYDLGDWKFDVEKQTFTHYLTSEEIAGICQEYTSMAPYLEAVGIAQEENILSAQGGVRMLQDVISIKVSAGMDDVTWLDRHVFDEDERTWSCWSLHIQEIQHAMDNVYPGCSPLTEEEITDVADVFRDSLSHTAFNWDHDLEEAVRETVKRPGYKGLPASILEPLIGEDE